MSLLTVKNLTRTFGPLTAVRDVTFSVAPGSIVGFIGPNGAGKSTTMRIIATLDVPSQGEVTLDGLDVVHRPDLARPLIGYMPDRYGTYDDMTVWEFLDFFARAYRLKGSERTRRVESVMEFVGVGGLREKLTSALSKGMRQRVALGRTLLHDPKLLLLDEPADGLDPRARIELRELLKALAAQGKAILITSHILTELSEVCDACAIIEQGRLLAQGSVAEVLAGAQGGTSPQAELSLVVPRRHGAEGVAKAQRALLEQPQVSDVRLEGQRLRFKLTAVSSAPVEPGWGEEAAAAVLAALVKAEVPVCELKAKELDLEDAFMVVTKGKVQ